MPCADNHPSQTDAENRVSIARGTTFSVAQIAIAIIVSTLGTMIFTSLGFLAFQYRRQRQKQLRAVEGPRQGIKRVDTTSSIGTANTAWTSRPRQRGPEAKPTEPRAMRVGCQWHSPDRSDSIAVGLSPGHDRPEQSQRQPDWPLAFDSRQHQPHAQTTVDGERVEGLYLFPKIVQIGPRKNSLRNGASRFNVDNGPDEEDQYL